MSMFNNFKQKQAERNAKYEEKRVEIKARRDERLDNIKAKRADDSDSIDTTNLLMPLKDRGDKILANNLSSDEKILVKLQGEFGQALVLTDKRLYVVKWGMQTNQTFGGKCTAYEYRNITAIEIRKKMITRYVQILTPATQSNIGISVWDKDKNGNNAMASDSVVTYNSDKKKDALFQEAVNLGRRLISQAHATGATVLSQDDSLDKIERLAKLKEQGAITQDEFDKKKAQLLDL
jgi:hypothetical protein